MGTSTCLNGQQAWICPTGSMLHGKAESEKNTDTEGAFYLERLSAITSITTEIVHVLCLVSVWVPVNDYIACWETEQVSWSDAVTIFLFIIPTKHCTVFWLQASLNETVFFIVSKAEMMLLEFSSPLNMRKEFKGSCLSAENHQYSCSVNESHMAVWIIFLCYC